MADFFKAIAQFFQRQVTLFRRGGQIGEVPSPHNLISPYDLHFDPRPDNDLGTLSIENLGRPIWVTTVQNTNSMESCIDQGHIVILSAHPMYLDELDPGDIIVWQRGVVRGTQYQLEQKIHSIIEINEDAEGWYCRTQGLNINQPDPYRIRKNEVKWVALMVIWSDLSNPLFSQRYR